MAERDGHGPWLLEDIETASDGEQRDEDVGGMLGGSSGRGGAQEAGLQPSASWLGKVRGFHPGFFGFELAYNRYVNTLLVSMRYFESVRDDERLSRVLLALLHGERHWMIDLALQHWNIALHDRLSEVLMVVYRFLLRHKSLVPTDEIRRFLRKAEQYQPNEDKKARLRELGATLLAEQGRLADAYDALPQPAALVSTTLKNPKTNRHDKMLGVLRKNQLYNLLRSCGDGASWDRLQHDPQRWGRAGRNGRQLAAESKAHLRRALEKDPKDTTLYVHIIQILLDEGDVTGARHVALAMIDADERTEHFDFDANAYCLMFLLRDIESAVGEDVMAEANMEPAVLERALQCCFRMLRMDPKSVPTLRVVVNLFDAFQGSATDCRDDVMGTLVHSVGVLLPFPIRLEEENPARTVQVRALVIVEEILHSYSVRYLESLGTTGVPRSRGPASACVDAMALIASQRYWHPTLFNVPCTEEGYCPLTVLHAVWLVQTNRELLRTCMTDGLDAILCDVLPDGRGEESTLPQSTKSWIGDRLQLYLQVLVRL